jgi:hypothetical protein
LKIVFILQVIKGVEDKARGYICLSGRITQYLNDRSMDTFIMGIFMGLSDLVGEIAG